jgi:N-dimethylarginine dimethylaminohydrolase
MKKLFKKVVHIPVDEAIRSFSLNAHVINIDQAGRKVALIHAGSNVTHRTLIEAGYEVIELNTSEFMKSGGSVFCMKMMVY